MKYNQYEQKDVSCYFWRTTQQQEIDYIEETIDTLDAYEFKWNRKAKEKFPKTFIRAYPHSTTNLITPENFEQFLGL